MSGAPLRTWRVRGGGGPPPFDWADGLTIKAPADFFAPEGEWIDAAAAPQLRYDREALDALRERRLWTPRPPVSARLPFAYHRVPAWARTLAAQALGRLRTRRLAHADAFPQWPLDLSVDFLADLLSSPSAAPARIPVVLTHDIDSPEGLTNLIERFVPLEERLGVRSVNYIVPKKWPLDYGVLDDVVARGHRLGVHGYDHANRTPYCDAAERRGRVEAVLPFVERYGVKGYRAPSLCRTPALIDELAPHFRYDSSVPTSGGLFPTPDNGCASARPFRLRRIWEIPITLPRDGSLLFLGYSADAILRLWQTCAARLIRANGMIVLLTHCEDRFSGGRRMLRTYEALLEFLRAQRELVFPSEAELLDGIAGRAPPGLLG